ncbi:RING1 and YY1-binding protein B-like [Paramacrobiotus metropolitanus]|uniref:RING1 and YY1-binding protein B-like n=1 Tax=Paramacrobiotus metropolitanus TaxID=2943436 RepID=UPI0024459BC5|nr:RING1 and YY1-binding protein B-like [Paramacrobiotus metropolitanus]
MEVKVKGVKRKSFDTEGEWNCPHCTFLNTAKAFRCGACEIQRGTSTRRAGLNPQIMQQQEMEQLLAKDRLKQQRAKARTQRSISPSPFPSPTASTSRGLSETPSNASSYTPPEGILFPAKSVRPVTLRPSGSGKRAKKSLGLGSSTLSDDSPAGGRGRGTIFPIAHNGVELEFEEFIASDASVSEEEDDSDDDSDT